MTEHSRKVLLCFETAGYSDIQNTRLGRAQHFFRALDPKTQDKLMGCLSR
jgi:hypothetical protein